jgi:4'-phosphopantetheinyl transferase
MSRRNNNNHNNNNVDLSSLRLRWAFNYVKWMPSEEEWELALGLLDSVEKARICRFHRPLASGTLVGRFNPDAKASCAGRLLMLLMVENLFGFSWREAKFERTQHGKPFLRNIRRWHDMSALSLATTLSNPDAPATSSASPKTPSTRSSSSSSIDESLLSASEATSKQSDDGTATGTTTTNTTYDVHDARQLHPLLKRFPNFNFNVSHHGDWVVLATEPEYLVGVDVMKREWPRRTTIADFFRTMSDCFTEHEWSTIRGAGDEWRQLSSFYMHWTLKESYIKAIGIGLGLELQTADFTPSPASPATPERASLKLNGRAQPRWRFDIYEYLDQEHVVSVALGPPEEELPLEEESTTASGNKSEAVPSTKVAPQTDLATLSVPPFAIIQPQQLFDHGALSRAH